MKRMISWNMRIDNNTGDYVATAKTEGITKRGQHKEDVEKGMREALKEYYHAERTT